MGGEAGPLAPAADERRARGRRRSRRLPAAVLGPDELWRLFAAAPEVRFRVPSALGVADLDALIPENVSRRSTADVAPPPSSPACSFRRGPTSRRSASSGGTGSPCSPGPPEMGKTAIARMIGLAALTDGWEVHECIRPDELWSRFARDRRQVFVADDAFGSTEYRPEAAERWPSSSTASCVRWTTRHWLVWTSRPAPLKAGLRRIHREHGVERFPQPAEITVDTARLDAGENALVLFRHAKARLAPRARDGARAAAGLAHRLPPALHPGADPPLRGRPPAGARAQRRRRRRGARRRRDPRADGRDGLLVPRAHAGAARRPARAARRVAGPGVGTGAHRVHPPPRAVRTRPLAGGGRRPARRTTSSATSSPPP